MNDRPLACPRCAGPLPRTLEELTQLERCGQCGVALEAHVFPALFRPVQTAAPAALIVAEGEAGCFYHPQKRAVAHCDACGRFVCSLCDVEVNGQHLCPACLETGRKKGRLSNLDNRRTLYDSLALTLTLLPVLFWPVTLMTAPAAVFVAVRYWKKPGSVVRRSKTRFVLAIVIALIQIAGWGILFWIWMRG